MNGRAATLELFAPDYDGGHKGLVQWEDGSHDVVPGSRVVKGAVRMTENAGPDDAAQPRPQDLDARASRSCPSSA